MIKKEIDASWALVTPCESMPSWWLSFDSKKWEPSSLLSPTPIGDRDSHIGLHSNDVCTKTVGFRL